MLKALFYTTKTTEPIENVDAWIDTMGPAEHVTFDINGPPNDVEVLERAEAFEPDIIFYIGGVEGAGLPSDDTLRVLKARRPSVIFVGDFADPPWLEKMTHYRAARCFNLMVAMDGVRGCPADLVTLTPIDLTKYDGPVPPRDIRCGFGGNMMTRPDYEHLTAHGLACDPRSTFFYSFGPLVEVRMRELTGNYAGYVEFMQRCQIVLNTAWTGSGAVMHVKGRVLEATFAGAAVLEPVESPAHDWFPPDTFLKYKDADQARDIIENVGSDEIADRANAAGVYAREHYNPGKIYAEIVERVGL